MAELIGWCQNSPSVAIAGAVAIEPIAQPNPGHEHLREMISALGFLCGTDLSRMGYGLWEGHIKWHELRGVVRTIILLK